MKNTKVDYEECEQLAEDVIDNLADEDVRNLAIYSLIQDYLNDADLFEKDKEFLKEASF